MIKKERPAKPESSRNVHRLDALPVPQWAKPTEAEKRSHENQAKAGWRLCSNSLTRADGRGKAQDSPLKINNL